MSKDIVVLDDRIRIESKFSSEALEKLAALGSPYLPKIYEFSDNHIVLEKINGKPLSETVIPVNSIKSVVLEICDGLAAIHSAGVIHRDIKPSNIMMCDDGHIRIVDFDAARVKKETADKDTRFIGTDGFAPPEQYGFMQTDERSDIYALGVVIKLLLRENYQKSPLRKIAEKCMRFNPEQRYGSVQDVIRAIKLCDLWKWLLIPAAALVITGTVIFICNNHSVNIKTDEIHTETSATTASSELPIEIETTAVTAIPQTEITTVTSSTSESIAETTEAATTTETTEAATTTETTEAATTTETTLAESVNTTSELTETTTIVSSAATTSAKTETTDETEITSETSADQEIIVSETEKISVNVIPEDELPVLWETLMLPDKFPKLSDRLSYYEKDTASLTFEWLHLDYDKAKKAYNKLKKWKSDWNTADFQDNDELAISAELKNDECEITIYRYSDGLTQIWVRYKNSKIELYRNNLLPEYTVPKGSKRKIKWESIENLPKNFPKVSDSVTAIEQNYFTEIFWDKMSQEEFANVLSDVSGYCKCESDSIRVKASDFDTVYYFDVSGGVITLTLWPNSDTTHKYQCLLNIGVRDSLWE